MEIYFEKNVINATVNKAKVKRLTVLRIVLLAVLCIGLLVLSNTLPWNATTIPFNIAIFLALICPTVGGTLIITRYFRLYNCEYDYVISENKIKIVRILNSTKRKTIATTDILMIEKIGFVESKKYREIAKSVGYTLVDATCNPSDYYLYFITSINNTKTVIVCEYDEKFIDAIKKSVQVDKIYDENFKKYTKKDQ